MNWFLMVSSEWNIWEVGLDTLKDSPVFYLKGKNLATGWLVFFIKHDRLWHLLAIKSVAGWYPRLEDLHSVWKSPKKSHSILRAMFTYWLDISLKIPKMDNFGEFLKCDIFGDFQTLWIESNLGGPTSRSIFTTQSFFFISPKKGSFSR